MKRLIRQIAVVWFGISLVLFSIAAIAAVISVAVIEYRNGNFWIVGSAIVVLSFIASVLALAATEGTVAFPKKRGD